MWSKINEFWSKNEYRIILLIGFILVAAISFQVGLIKGREIKENPVIIEKITQNSCDEEKSAGNASNGPNLTQNTIASQESENTTANQDKNCAYVGSKNSNKFHLPSCRWAKNIKPENLVCFSGEDDAKSRGYLPDKNCIK
jgi:hypothetical protein